MLAEAELDPVRRERLAELLPEARGLLREHAVGALHQGDGGAEAGDGLGHLHADRAAAEDDQPLGDLLDAGDLAVGPDAVELVQAGNRRDHRIGPGGDHDVLGAVGAAVDRDLPRPRDGAGAADDRDALVVVPAALRRVVVVGDHVVAPVERGAGADAALHRLGGAGRLARVLERLARAQQRLGGHAGPVVALAAEELALHDRHLQPAVSEVAGAVAAAGPQPRMMTS